MQELLSVSTTALGNSEMNGQVPEKAGDCRAAAVSLGALVHPRDNNKLQLLPQRHRAHRELHKRSSLRPPCLCGKAVDLAVAGLRLAHGDWPRHGADPAVSGLVRLSSAHVLLSSGWCSARGRPRHARARQCGPAARGGLVPCRPARGARGQSRRCGTGCQPWRPRDPARSRDAPAR